MQTKAAACGLWETVETAKGEGQAWDQSAKAPNRNESSAQGTDRRPSLKLFAQEIGC